MNTYTIKIDNIEVNLEQLPNGKFKKPDLADKYKGFKYSIAPLKQVVEEIMIFQKPYKTKSCLHDTLEYENGNEKCLCGALDIDGNRCGTEKRFSQPAGNDGKENVPIMKSNNDYKGQEVEGRYPAQTFCGGTYLTAMVLDDTIDNEIYNKIINHYDKLYLQSLREKVLSTPISDKNGEGTALLKRVLLEDIENNNGGGKPSELREEKTERVDRETEKNLVKKGKDSGELQSVERGIGDKQRIYNRGLSELPEKVLENIRTNGEERQQEDTTTQNNNGNKFKQNTKEVGVSSSQEWSEERQQAGELRDLQEQRPFKTSSGGGKESEGTKDNYREFTERDIFIEKEAIPEEWLKHFSYACDILVSTAEVLDKQSGEKKGATSNSASGKSIWGSGGAGIEKKEGYNDTGGCSKILHKCDLEKDEHDLYLYQPKVSKSERNAGCEEMPITNANRDNAPLTHAENRQASTHNSHPTLKPIALNERILKLFKTPNPQKIIYPFAGSGSEVIGGYKAGFTDWSGCELNPEYCEIAKARIKHWTKEDVEIDKTEKQIEFFKKEGLPVMAEVVKKVREIKQDSCECGGKIKKTASGRCCEWCLKDY